MPPSGLAPGATPLHRVPGYPVTLLTMAIVFACWTLLLPVVPLAVSEAGGSDTMAGATTGVFMGVTVLFQLLTPMIISGLGYRRALLGGALLLGPPSLGHLLGMAPLIALGFSGIRGMGFGVLTVTFPALIAEIVPARSLGKATGLSGVMVGASQMLTLPAGLALAGVYSPDFVFVLTGGVGVLACLLALRLPRVALPRADDGTRGVTLARVRRMAPRILLPWAAMLSVSIAFGGLSNFLPLAADVIDPVRGATTAGLALSAIGATVMVGRLVSGVVSDRDRAGLVLPYALCSGWIGLAAITAVIAAGASPWWLLIGAAAFGTAFGAVQNESLLILFAKISRSRLATASTVWNVAYDGGMGLGSITLGVIAAQLGYLWVFAASGALVLAAFAGVASIRPKS